LPRSVKIAWETIFTDLDILDKMCIGLETISQVGQRKIQPGILDEEKSKFMRSIASTKKTGFLLRTRNPVSATIVASPPKFLLRNRVS
jgi:hypothetical protein